MEIRIMKWVTFHTSGADCLILVIYLLIIKIDSNIFQER